MCHVLMCHKTNQKGQIEWYHGHKIDIYVSFNTKSTKKNISKKENQILKSKRAIFVL